MDPQQMMMLMQQGGQPREHPLSRAFGGTPMYGGIPMQPSQVFDFSRFGLGSGTPTGMMAGMVMQGMLPQLMGPNMTPGQFDPTQNFFDHRYSQQQFMDRRRSLEQASGADTETYFRMIRGAARMQGVDYAPGSAQEGQARRFAGDITRFAPIIGDMMPDTFDQLHGARGSAGMLSRQVSDAGRYMFDPASGRLGLSAESAGQMSKEVFGSLFGPGADLSRMRGLGAGRAGQLFGELQRRGLGPAAAMDQEEGMSMLRTELGRGTSNIRSTELQTMRRTLGRQVGVGEDDTSKEAVEKINSALNDMGRNDPQAVATAMRSFNSSRVSKSIENMAGAVSAMRDIFGDMGRPNAPMLELVNGLQALTQGGMATMSPQRLEQSVRQTYAIAKYTGLGTEGMLGLAGTVSQGLESQGMSRALAPQIAQDTAAYGFGYGQAGQPRNFGTVDRDMATQMDARLRMGAARSPQAVRLAALMQFSDEFQRTGSDGKLTSGFADNTEAYAMSQAVRDGKQEYTFNGTRKSIFQSQSQMTRILSDAGVSRNEATQALTQNPAAAAKFIDRYNLTNPVRESQGDLDARQSFSGVMSNSFTSSLARTQLSRDRQQQLAQAAGPATFDITRELYDEKRELFDEGREGERNRAIAERLRTRLGRRADGVDDATLANAVGSSLQNSEAFTQTPGSGFEGYRNFIGGVIGLNSRRNFQMQRTTVAAARQNAQGQQAASGIGQASPIARISDFLQSVGPGGGNIQELIGKALGGIDLKDIPPQLQSALQMLSGVGGVAGAATGGPEVDPNFVGPVQPGQAISAATTATNTAARASTAVVPAAAAVARGAAAITQDMRVNATNVTLATTNAVRSTDVASAGTGVQADPNFVGPVQPVTDTPAPRELVIRGTLTDGRVEATGREVQDTRSA
jgi:hypothetical protein